MDSKTQKLLELYQTILNDSVNSNYKTVKINLMEKIFSLLDIRNSVEELDDIDINDTVGEDNFGNVVVAGDDVIYIATGSRSLNKGKVANVTPSGFRIQSTISHVVYRPKAYVAKI